jgi:hypothetical protein
MNAVSEQLEDKHSNGGLIPNAYCVTRSYPERQTSADILQS